MSNLTPELQEQIEQEAIDATKDRKDTDFDIGWNQGYEKGYESAGIKYAEKWQEAEQRATEAKKLLDEVFRKHESGLLPDRFVYEKIKSFLYPAPKPTTNE